MELKILKPRKAINKAFLKIKPNRTEIESFKTNLIQLLDRTNDTESEEFHKNLVSDFLKKTYYEPNNFINTKGRNDLVIHNGNKAKSTVGVIIEAKKPTNKAEMLTKNKINVKAFQELVLYYLRERITHKNLEIKYLVATNINEWFIFDSNIFEKQFAQNKVLVMQFNDFENGRLAGKTTDFFYKEIAEPFINDLKQDIEFTFFDIREYENPLRNDNPKDDNKLISLFKLFSPEHLLKLPFANDSNSLDKRFYGELLHIIGLSETKDGSKKLIERNRKGERNTGSFLENAIIQLDSLDKINILDNPRHFGTTQEERLFNVGLELSITWINRILFLKLLEAQLKTYHKGDKSYEFLSIDKIQNYDDLNSLFFQVLAKKQSERNEDVKELFTKVPYLNSSLFEPTGIEHDTLFISNLRDDKAIPIYFSTVLKSENGKKLTGNLSTLEYLFEFLNAYDFSSEGSEAIQEDNKTLINASVLGLIFEKINGYKDGSFFTPGFITMYMCRETIRKAVVQKFNETKDWNCKSFEELKEDIKVYIKSDSKGRKEVRKEANKIINELKICDPAVGSGHFLVSALNEIIAIKNELSIIVDKNIEPLSEYSIDVVNDELIISDFDNHFFQYNTTNKESQRIQKTLFHEKQTIIENCLFGVDINPNSVKICRLRLWIELLKNAYYKNESELETLPNIDINIKCGNSLISRFELDTDLKKALKSSKWTIDSYRIAVDTYRNAQNKEQKREMEKLIADIKKDFRSEISLNDPKVKKLNKVKGEIFGMANQGQLFEMSQKEKTEWNKKLTKLTEDSKKLETIIEEIKNNKIYEEAFEWRFEFPEVLDDNGDFLGFDVVIGNPPYVQIRELPNFEQNGLKSQKAFIEVAKGSRQNLFQYFIGLSYQINKENGLNSLIYQNSFLSEETTKSARNFIFNNSKIISIDSFPERDNENKRVFEDAKMSVCVIIVKKKRVDDFTFLLKVWEDKTMTNSKIIKYSKVEIYSLFKESLKIPLISEHEKILFLKLLSIKNKFIFKVKSGELDMTATKPYFTSNEKYPIVIKGAQVQKYFISQNPSQGKIEYLDTVNYFLKNSNSGRILDSNCKRIVMQRITGVDSKIRLIMTIVNPISFCANSTNYIVTKDDSSLLYLLSILNSRLINYYFKTTSTNTNVTGKELESLPVLLLNQQTQQPLIDLVNQILIIKTQNLEADTTSLETEIDQLVYKLYDLTEEEIKIIEEANA